MCVTAARAGKPEPVGHARGEVVFVFRDLPVQDLNGVDVIEQRPLHRLLRGQPGLIDADHEESPERVGHDHEAVRFVDFPSELLQVDDSLDVLLQAEDEDVPLIRGNFISPQDQESVFLSQFFHTGRVPDVIVVGQADPVQADSLCLLDQCVYRGGTAGRCGESVHMQIDCHFGRRRVPIRLSRWAWCVDGGLLLFEWIGSAAGASACGALF